MSSSWNAAVAFGIFAFAAATFLAAGVALFLGLWPICRDRRRRREQAALVRSQLAAHLAVLRDVLAPRSHALDLLQREAYEPLHYLWTHTHLLEAEEFPLVHQTHATLLALRNKPSITLRQVRAAQGLIDRTCAVLERYARDSRPAGAEPLVIDALTASWARWANPGSFWTKKIEPIRPSHTAGR